MPLRGEIRQLVEDRLWRPQHLLHRLDGCRPLDVDLAKLVRQVDAADVAPARVRLEVAGHDAAHARVDDHYVLVVLDLVDDAVVDRLAPLVEEDAVHALAGRDRRVVLAHAALEVPREAPLQQVEGATSEHPDDRHVTRVEEAGVRDDGQVLVAGAAVPNGHQVVAELDDVGTVRLVPVEQGRLLLVCGHVQVPWMS